MHPVEHVAAEAALKAKHKADPQHKSDGHALYTPPSAVSRFAAIGIWLLAAATIAALFWLR